MGENFKRFMDRSGLGLGMLILLVLGMTTGRGMGGGGEIATTPAAATMVAPASLPASPTATMPTDTRPATTMVAARLILNPGPHEVTIAAAADLKFALEEIKNNLAQEAPNLNLKITYGSSGNFYTQLVNQAPFEVYLSADIQYPQKLVAQELTLQNSLIRYAQGRVVLWVAKDSPLAKEKLGVELLKHSRIKKIAMANPKHAPYGRAAEAALKRLGVYEEIKEKLVLGENIAQTAQFVESGAADVGLLALSLAMAPAMKEKGVYWELPAESYPAIEQGGVIMKWTKDPEAARVFTSYLCGPTGQATLKAYGFIIPETKVEK